MIKDGRMSDVTAAAARAAADHSKPMVDAVTAVAQTATYGGAASAVVSNAFSLSDWAALVSMSVAVLGFALQLLMAARKIRQERFIREAEDLAQEDAEDAEARKP